MSSTTRSSSGAPSASSAVGVIRTLAPHGLAHVSGTANRARWISGCTSRAVSMRGDRRSPIRPGPCPGRVVSSPAGSPKVRGEPGRPRARRSVIPSGAAPRRTPCPGHRPGRRGGGSGLRGRRGADRAGSRASRDRPGSGLRGACRGSRHSKSASRPSPFSPGSVSRRDAYRRAGGGRWSCSVARTATGRGGASGEPSWKSPPCRAGPGRALRSRRVSWPASAPPRPGRWRGGGRCPGLPAPPAPPDVESGGRPSGRPHRTG